VRTFLARSLPIVAGAAAFALLLPAQPADAAPSSGRCLGSSGPRCHFQYGRVLSVDDGDTLVVDISGDGTSAGRKVRLNGINAMELHRYSEDPANWRGECHSARAAKLAYRLLRDGGWRVRLAAQDLGSRSGTRLRRQVSFRAPNGWWRNLDGAILRRGLALWSSRSDEWAWNRMHAAIGQKAAAARVGLYDTDFCGAGPAAGNPIRVLVKWDANGVDGRNLNSEWARIRNNGSSPLTLGGWWFRDAALRGYKGRGYSIPAGVTVPAHGQVTIHVGCGTRTATRLYWCQPGAVFDNYNGGPKYTGDGGYLFDPQGDLRVWMTYPCFNHCADPLDGKLRITAARARDPEYVDVTNVSGRTTSLEGALLVQRPHSYAFARAEVLRPGRSLRLWMASGTWGASVVRSWHLSGPQLRNSGDRVTLRTYRWRRLSCRAWGSARC
jgi:endonuclease YncB( thermonuclease family)